MGGSKRIATLLRKENEAKKKKEKESGVTTMQIPDELEVPDPLPARGTMVIFTYGDPNIIGGSTVEMVTLVTNCTEQGLVTGWAFTQMGMQAAGPNGQPVGLPPLIPVGNVPYSSESKKLSWRYDEEIEAEADEAEADEVSEVSDAD